MKVLYILPDRTVRSGGNWITTSRLAKGLKEIGITVDIIEVKDVTKNILMKYDIVHAFHVFKSFLKIVNLLIKTKKITIISFTGTDLKQLKEMKESKNITIDLLNKVGAIIVFHKEARKGLIKEGVIADKIKVIPQATIPINTSFSIEKKQFIENVFSLDYVNFIFAGGIRKVKGPLNLIQMMSSLVKKVENIKLVIIGPILEEGLREKFEHQIKNKEWIKYLGEVSHQEAQHFIFKSDIVINNSISEGMPNTLLEGQQLGKPLLAKDNAGNRSIVTHGINGFLFKNKGEFEYYAIKLVQNLKLREKMGRSGLELNKNYNWNHEINKYEKVYQDLNNSCK